ncbi:MAG: hypothetical protein ACP5VQ_04465, partial [Phycisphaerae bacterium]
MANHPSYEPFKTDKFPNKTDAHLHVVAEPSRHVLKHHGLFFGLNSYPTLYLCRSLAIKNDKTLA